MTGVSHNANLFRASRLLRLAVNADILQPGSPLRLARPIDAESLTGRHEGRARKSVGGAARPGLSSALQQRTGPTRSLFTRTVRRSAHAFDPRQRAVVKVHYFGHGGGGGTALRSHARYIARDGVARETKRMDLSAEGRGLDAPLVEADRHGQAAQDRGAQRTIFYDKARHGIDGAELATQWAKQDRRHFRIILAPENGTRLGDLPGVTREIMSRAEAALGTRLEWFAVDHWDTDNPHTHIILRGRQEDGRDLVIPREFVSHGFRNAARDVATERLGPRTREDGRLALEREARAHRWTRLDQLIAQQVGKDGRIRIAHLKALNGAPDLTDALRARAHELKRLGIATEVRRNVLSLDAGWRERLGAMEAHLDIRKTLVRTRLQQQLPETTARQFAKALRLRPGPDR